MARQDQEPGFLDTVFNSSLTWPQQMLWRAYRVANEEGVDFFSRKGFMDPALVPLLGWFADHKEDVMPDYMARELGVGEGFVPEIATAILTDPLFFLTGPLTGSARAARGVQGAKQAMGPTVAANMLASKLGKQAYVDQLSVGGYRKLLDDGKKALLGMPGKPSRKYLKKIDKARKYIDALPEEQLGQNIKSLLAQQSDRRLGIGIPGLAGLGAQVDVPLTHNNWWQVFAAGTRSLNKTTHSFGLAFATKHIAGLPWINKAIAPWAAGVREVPRQLLGGLAIGGEARSITKQAGQRLSAAEMSNLRYWKGLEGAGPVMKYLEKHGKEKTLKTFTDFLWKGEKGQLVQQRSPQEAFMLTIAKLSGRKNTEHADALWGRLNPIDGAPSTGPIGLSDDGVEASAQMQQVLDTAFQGAEAATDHMRNPGHQLGFKWTKEGERFKDLLHARKEGKFSEDFYRSFFNAGAHVRKMQNRLFRSGADSALDADSIFDFQSALSRNQEAVNAMALYFTEGLAQATRKQKTYSVEEMNRLIGQMLQLEQGPGELAASMHLAEWNPSNALRVATSQDNYSKRYHSVVNSLGHQLASSGADTEMRRALIRDFQSQSAGHMPSLDKQALAARYEDIIRVYRDKIPEYTDAERRLMRRRGNRYMLWGTSHKAKAIGRMSNDEIAESIRDIESFEKNRSYLTVDEIDSFVRANQEGGKGGDAFVEFERRWDLTPPQVAALVGRRKQNQIAYRLKDVEREEVVRLWPEDLEARGSSFFSPTLSNARHFETGKGLYTPRELAVGGEVVWMDTEELLTLVKRHRAEYGGGFAQHGFTGGGTGINPKKLAELRASLDEGGEALREPLDMVLAPHRIGEGEIARKLPRGESSKAAEYGSMQHWLHEKTSQLTSHVLDLEHFDGYHRALVLSGLGIRKVPVRLKTKVEKVRRGSSQVQGGVRYGALSRSSARNAVGGQSWPTHIWTAFAPENPNFIAALKEDKIEGIEEITGAGAELIRFPRIYTSLDDFSEGMHRGAWTVNEADKALKAQGFRLTKDLFGYHATPTVIKEGGKTGWKAWGWTESKGHSLDELMRYTDDWIQDATRTQGLKHPQYWSEVHSPKVTRAKTVEVPAHEVDALRDAMSAEQLRAAKGYKARANGRKVFKEENLRGKGEYISEMDSSALDYARLLKVQHARKVSSDAGLSLGDSRYEGHVNPKMKTQVTVSPHRAITKADIKLEELDKDLYGTTRTLTDAELPDAVIDYAYGSLELDEFLRQLRANIKANGIEGADVPVEYLATAAEALTRASRAVVDSALKHFPEDIRHLYDQMRSVNAAIFEEAQRSGVWVPGSPVGYLANFFNTAGRTKLNTILDNIDAAEMSVMTRLGRKSPERFKRHTDTMSLDQLEELRRALRQDTLKAHGWVNEAGDALDGIEYGSSAQMKRWSDELEDLMQENGIIHRTFGKPLPWTDERLNHDPIISMVMRLAHAGQSKSFEDFFGRYLSSPGTAPGESLAVGGKIVDVISDVGEKHTIPTKMVRTVERKLKAGKPVIIDVNALNREALLAEAKVLGIAEDAIDSTVIGMRKQIRAARKKLPKAKIPTVKSVEEYLHKTEFIPEHIVLETDEGVQHLIHKKMSEETGFGWLDLGNVAEEAKKGYTPTVAKSFVSASLRSDLHNKFALGELTHDAALKLVGHNAVFGSHANVAGAIKVAGKSMEIAPTWVRSFDNINFMIKQFQTVYRLPFHTGNLSSGVFQAHMAGVGPKNLVAGYAEAMRMLHGPSDEAIKSLDIMHDTLNVEGFSSTKSTFFPRHHVVDTAKRMGLRLDEVPSEELRALGLNRIDDVTLNFDNGRDASWMDIAEVAGDQHLFTTFASSLTRGTRTVPENLLRLKLSTWDPEQVGKLGFKRMAGALTDWKRRKGFHPGIVTEHSEIVNRLATVNGLLHEGHTIERAVQITKQAHVPYERLTPFERNFVKRFSVFYTFPRHYIPWAWSKFMQQPQELAVINNTIRDQKLFTTDEGALTLKLGDYRLNVGRLNANLEAALVIAAFADNFAIPFGEKVGLAPAGRTPYSPSILTKQMGTMGLLNIGGAAGMFLGTDRLLPQGTRAAGRSAHSWEEAMGIIWPIKMALPHIFGGPAHPTQEELSPHVNYTPMEAFIANSNWGLGVRKVRPQQEFRYAYFQYKRHIQQLKMRIAATEDSSTRERLMENAQILGERLQAMGASAFAQRIE